MLLEYKTDSNSLKVEALKIRNFPGSSSSFHIQVCPIIFCILVMPLPIPANTVHTSWQMALISAPLILSGLATSFNEVKDVYVLEAICLFNSAKLDITTQRNNSIDCDFYY